MSASSPPILELGPEFYDPVEAANFPKTELRYRNDAAAQTVGMDGLSDQDWCAHFGRFKPLEGNLIEPLALRYHGHQFRHYNPDIGDGRGFLFAQVRSDDGRLLDLGTKGSGQTPYSRAGDGRLTLLGGIREVLATSYLEYLGVNTSKSFSLIETGESLHRGDEPSPTRSAVLTRLSHSHIRFGTFQRLAYLSQTDNLEKLVDYVCRHYYAGEADDAQSLLYVVMKRSADTVASWMAAGFVHGVMNTDNMNITGESFDYGPYRFLPSLQPNHTAAYFDHNGLYAYARQPEAMYWNLMQLAQSLALITDDQALIDLLPRFSDFYRDAMIHHVFRRLGIAPKGETEKDIAFVLQTFEWLETSQAPWPQFWHDVCGGAKRAEQAKGGKNNSFYQLASFDDWLKALRAYDSVTEGFEPDDGPAPSLLYDEIGALWDPIDREDDWSLFHDKVKGFS